MFVTREVADVAQALGMKTREIVHITPPVRDPRLGRIGWVGVIVKLHDDSIVFLADNGTVIHPIDVDNYVLVDEEPDEDVDEHEGQVDDTENAGDGTPPEQVVNEVVDEQHEGQAVVVDEGQGDGEPVPDGNADAVLTWVGDDLDRARRALEAEGGREKPRVGVTAKLRELLDGGADE